jgi:hypothetical protein
VRTARPAGARSPSFCGLRPRARAGTPLPHPRGRRARARRPTGRAHSEPSSFRTVFTSQTRSAARSLSSAPGRGRCNNRRRRPKVTEKLRRSRLSRRNRISKCSGSIPISAAWSGTSATETRCTRPWISSPGVVVPIGSDHLRGFLLPHPRRLVGLRTDKFRP